MTDLSRKGPLQPASPRPGGFNTLTDSLRLAASRGQLETVKDLLTSGATFEPDQDGRNALHFAAQEGQAEVCKYLVAHGCDVDLQDVMGYSPLLRAASQGSLETVQVLLDAGCDISIQDEHGNAAIHEACWNGFSKTAELLVKYNCNVFLTNKAGFTALHLAAQNGHNESSRVLLYSGCDPDLKNNYGDTALHTAARYGHAGVARILISAKCKISEQNKNGDTALHIAAALKRRKIAKILVESGIDADLVNKQNEKALDVAKRKEHPEIILIISTYSKPRQPSPHRRLGDHIGVTFKEEIDFEDGPVVCPEDDLPQKPEPKSEKQEKERRFFFFKRKKKDKEKEKPVTAPGVNQKKAASGMIQPRQEKIAVHGFFSQYVPRDGVQFYRDLAGNIKQGPIGYAPVCQCGPSLRRLENDLTNTRESLYHHFDASHHALSQRIDDLDIRTKQQAYATEAMIHGRINNERNACHTRITERLLEERLETQAMLGHANADMKDQLEYWLSDKLASYGHCLDHHHDDSALPPRNLFSDFPTMGRLVRSRSDETLSASDCSGKFRKKDFYANRQAAMQQIRGWDVPLLDRESGKDKPRRRERNNNSHIPNNNRVVTHAQVHTNQSNQHYDDHHNLPSPNQDILSPSTNSTTSPGTVNNSLNTGLSYSNTGQSFPGVYGSGRRGHLPGQQTAEDTSKREVSPAHVRARSQSRVTFSNSHKWQQTQQHYPPHRSTSSPPLPASPRNPVDQVSVNRQRNTYSVRLSSPSQHQTTPTSHHARQNLQAGGPPNTDIKSGEQEGSRTLMLTGHDKDHSNTGGSGAIQHRLTRYQDGYGVHYGRPRTLSTDSLLDEGNLLGHSQCIPRCRSVENTLEEKNTNQVEVHNSGYVTDSALRQIHTGNGSRRYTVSESPASRATVRYRLPETSAETSADGVSVQQESHGVPPYSQSQHESKNFLSGQVPSHTQSTAYNRNFLHRTPESLIGSPNTKTRDLSGDFTISKTQHKSMHALNDSSVNMGSSANNYNSSDSPRLNKDKPDSLCKSETSLATHYAAPVKECLQHKNLMPANTISSPSYISGNKEDSTCSSNQDSGYSSRNLGARRGIDTSAGTPSSSFSMERSGCNTPSNAGSPLTAQGEVINPEFKTKGNGHFQQSPVNVSALSSSSVPSAYTNTGSQDKENAFERRNADVRHASNLNSSASTRSERSNSSFKPQDANQNSSISYNRPSQSMPSKAPFVASNASRHIPLPVKSCTKFSYVDHMRSGSNTSPLVSSGGLSQTDKFQGASEVESGRLDNHRISRNSSRDNNSAELQPNSYASHQPQPTTYYNPHQSAQEQNHRPQTQTSRESNDFSNRGNMPGPQNNPPFSNSGSRTYKTQDDYNPSSLSQSTVQSHIQGWYQRKLLEAAQRLRQSQSYNVNGLDQPSVEDSKDVSYHSPRQDLVGRQMVHGAYSTSNHPQPQGITARPSVYDENNVQFTPRSQYTYHHQPNYSQYNGNSSYTQHPSNPCERFERRGSQGLNSQFPYSGVNPRTEPVNSRALNTYSNSTVQQKTYDQLYNVNNPYNTHQQTMSSNMVHCDPVKGSDV